MYTILIVEDTLAIREELCDIFLMEGYIVFQAENGRIGFEMALKENPDIIISDVLMPELNGFKMFNKLQKNKKTMSIPLIFLSAKGAEKDMNTGMNLGAADYLTKPININDLLKSVENKIKKK
jgi:two-component system sensor histidine kinase/response regulator